MAGFCSFTLDEEIRAITLDMADAVLTNKIDPVLHHFSEDVTVFGIDKSGGKGRAGELTHHPRGSYTEEYRQHQACKTK